MRWSLLWPFLLVLCIRCHRSLTSFPGSTEHPSLSFLPFIFLAALAVRCFAQAFSSGGEQGPVFTAVSGLLIAVASLVGVHGL